MSRKSTSSVKKMLINLFRYLHILISFGHKLRKEFTLFFVNLVKLASKFREGVGYKGAPRGQGMNCKFFEHILIGKYASKLLEISAISLFSIPLHTPNPTPNNLKAKYATKLLA